MTRKIEVLRECSISLDVVEGLRIYDSERDLKLQVPASYELFVLMAKVGVDGLHELSAKRDSK